MATTPRHNLRVGPLLSVTPVDGSEARDSLENILMDARKNPLESDPPEKKRRKITERHHIGGKILWVR